MNKNEILTPEEEITEEGVMPDMPEKVTPPEAELSAQSADGSDQIEDLGFAAAGPEEWDRKRKEAWEAELAPFKALRAQINEHDELMAETLYEVTKLELGELEL